MMMAVDWDIVLKYINRDMVCVECGVWEGDLSKRIYRENPKMLYLIDVWDNTSDNNKRYNKNVDFSKKYLKVCKEFSLKKNVKIIRERFQKALEVFEDNSIDWILFDVLPIDEYKLEFIKLSYKKVNVGGYICLYNFNNLIDSIMEEYKNKLKIFKTDNLVIILKKIKDE